MSATSEAGRELDALIAEKVMGWHGRALVRKRGEESWSIAYQHAPGKSFGDYSVYYTADGTKLYCGKPWSPLFPPRYSTDISAAFEVVEKMARDGWTFSLDGPNRSGLWEVIVEIRDTDTYGCAPSASLPLAICLAALKALENSSSPPVSSVREERDQ